MVLLFSLAGHILNKLRATNNKFVHTTQFSMHYKVEDKIISLFFCESMRAFVQIEF